VGKAENGEDEEEIEAVSLRNGTLTIFNNI